MNNYTLYILTVTEDNESHEYEYGNLSHVREHIAFEDLNKVTLKLSGYKNNTETTLDIDTIKNA